MGALRTTGSRRLCSLRRKLISGALLSLWLSLVALSAAPVLHRYFHGDAALPGHECVISTFTGSHILATAATPILPAPVFQVCGSQPVPARQPIPAPDRRLADSRAPPGFILSSTVIG